MLSSSKFLFVTLQLAIAFGWLNVSSTADDSHADPDLVVMAYNSYDKLNETVIFESIFENENEFEYQEYYRDNDDSGRLINIGLGKHLWTVEEDEDDPELIRGWMFRLRLIMQSVIDKYNKRGDFIALIGDATDVYITESLQRETLQQLKHRFLTQFASHRIVFSSQIWCCNPVELHSVGRRSWDALYHESGNVASMYKHLNAGLFMGYASALIDMAKEMELWDNTYHRHEAFHSLMNMPAVRNRLKMSDLEVDDDEWQLATWFFEDQMKDHPIATLDYQQDIFAVTGTQRVQQTDNGYVAFSRNHFFHYFGYHFPDSFSPDADMHKLEVCPYRYDAKAKKWTSTITGKSPLVFHFAGTEWLCACPVFAAEGFEKIPVKFRDRCLNDYDKWAPRVQYAIDIVTTGTDNNVEIYLYEEDDDTSERNLRRLMPQYLGSHSIRIEEEKEREEEEEVQMNDDRSLTISKGKSKSGKGKSGKKKSKSGGGGKGKGISPYDGKSVKGSKQKKKSRS